MCTYYETQFLKYSSSLSYTNYTLIKTSIQNSTSFNVNHRQYKTNSPVVFFNFIFTPIFIYFLLDKHLTFYVDYTFSFHPKTVIKRVERIF